MTVTEHVALVERSRAFLVNWASAGRIAAERIKEFHVKGQPSTAR